MVMMRKISVCFVLLMFILLNGFVHGQTELQLKPKVPRGKDLKLEWELIENGVFAKHQVTYRSRLTLKNASDRVLKGHNWAIYFNQTKHVFSVEGDEGVQISHINGDYYKLEPTSKFKWLLQGESVQITYLTEAWTIKMQGAPTGFYIVHSSDEGDEFLPESILDVNKVLIRQDQTKMHSSDKIPYPTGELIYNENLKIKHFPEDSLVQIMPTPYLNKFLPGRYELKDGLIIGYPSDFKNEAQFLKKKLAKDFNLSSKLMEGVAGDVVLLNEEVDSFYTGKDRYELSIANDQVVIKANNPKSIFYGIQSLRASIPVQAFQNKREVIKIKNVFVHDEARFGYRGMHLDVARHFNSKETVFKLLDAMAFYKLNTFHFHLTDDEGWRLEIPGLPELTEVGGRRGHTKDEMDMLMPALGSGPDPKGKTYGSGYYSVKDFVEILNYAKERHIEVIPELDFPGHARAAIVAMKSRYKKLVEAGDDEAAKEYVLHDPQDGSRYRSVQRYNDNVVCACQESTYSFLEKVVDEVIAMYQSAGIELKNIHIGGDEVPHSNVSDPGHGAWMYSPICKTFLLESDEYEKPKELYYYFVDRFSTILKERNVVTSGWEEIALKKSTDEHGESRLELNENFNNKGLVPYTWNNIWGWGGEDYAYQFANAGFEVVLAGASNNYYALSYNKNPLEPGYYWAGFVDAKRSWQYVPMNIYQEQSTTRNGDNVDDMYKSSKVRLTEEGAKNIKGLQGQMWSETVLGPEMMEYYIYPKMLGLVERCWSVDPTWTSIENDSTRFAQQDIDWGRFTSRLGRYELPRLSYLNGGVDYRIAAPGAIIEEGKLKVNMDILGFQCYYTTDGSEPNQTSIQYTSPVYVSGEKVKVKAYSENGNESLVTEILIP